MRPLMLLPALLGLLPVAARAAPGLADVTLPGGATLPYLVAGPAGSRVGSLLIAVHGYPRDARRTWDAATAAASEAGRTGDTLIVAPIFPVPQDEAERCHSPGVPVAAPGNAVWRCDSWAAGDRAQNAPLTSFEAMDALAADLLRTYPAARTVTIAGFSAGAQFVQHYVGFAASSPPSVRLRYVIADPGAFLYFGRYRPLPAAGRCPQYDTWKLGLRDRPDDLGRDGRDARAVYAAADIQYLEGALDSGTRPDAAPHALERNCGAERQGRYRLDRGENYAAYDARFLAHGRHRLTIVPGCAHSVTCVFPSPAARAVIFGN